jgi:hypothetical protein
MEIRAQLDPHVITGHLVAAGVEPRYQHFVSSRSARAVAN